MVPNQSEEANRPWGRLSARSSQRAFLVRPNGEIARGLDGFLTLCLASRVAVFLRPLESSTGLSPSAICCIGLWHGTAIPSSAKFRL